MRVTVVDSGYVCLVTGACVAYLGHRATCVDSNVEKIPSLSVGVVPIIRAALSFCGGKARKQALRGLIRV